MGLAAFNRRRELAGQHKMQGDLEAAAKEKAAALIAKGELPNPVDGDDPMPSTRGLEPSREAEEEWLSRHGVDGDDPPPSTEPGEQIDEEPTASLPDPRLTVDQKGKEILKTAKREARDDAPPTVLGAAAGHEPKDRAFTQETKGTVGKPAEPGNGGNRKKGG